MPLFSSARAANRHHQAVTWPPPGPKSEHSTDGPQDQGLQRTISAPALAGVPLAPPNPFDMPGSPPRARDAFDRLWRAIAYSGKGQQALSAQAFGEFGRFCKAEMLSVPMLVGRPFAPNEPSALELIWHGRNDLAVAGLMTQLPYGDYGPHKEVMVRRLSARAQCNDANYLRFMYDHYLPGRYLGAHTQGSVGGYSAYCFRNGLIYVGDIAGPSAQTRRQRGTLLGNSWRFEAVRPPLPRATLSDDVENFGAPALFGSHVGKLLVDDEEQVQGQFRDFPYGALIERIDGTQLRLEVATDLACLLVALPGQRDEALQRTGLAVQQLRDQVRAQQIKIDEQSAMLTTVVGALQEIKAALPAALPARQYPNHPQSSEAAVHPPPSAPLIDLL